MVTVIGLKELDKLITTGHLRGSDNIEFLKKHDNDPRKARELQDLIREQIHWLTGQQSTGGFITVLKGVSNDITESIIRSRSHEVVMLLPEPVDPVFLVLPDDLPCITIDVNSLSLAMECELTEDMAIRQAVAEQFVANKDVDGNYCYGFITEIHTTSNIKVLYSAETEAKAKALEAKSEYTNMVFSRIDTFSGPRNNEPSIKKTSSVTPSPNEPDINKEETGALDSAALATIKKILAKPRDIDAQEIGTIKGLLRGLKLAQFKSQLTAGELARLSTEVYKTPATKNPSTVLPKVSAEESARKAKEALPYLVSKFQAALAAGDKPAERSARVQLEDAYEAVADLEIQALIDSGIVDGNNKSELRARRMLIVQNLMAQNNVK